MSEESPRSGRPLAQNGVRGLGRASGHQFPLRSGSQVLPEPFERSESSTATPKYWPPEATSGRLADSGSIPLLAIQDLESFDQIVDPRIELPGSTAGGIGDLCPVEEVTSLARLELAKAVQVAGW